MTDRRPNQNDFASQVTPDEGGPAAPAAGAAVKTYQTDLLDDLVLVKPQEIHHRVNQVLASPPQGYRLHSITQIVGVRGCRALIIVWESIS